VCLRIVLVQDVRGNIWGRENHGGFRQKLVTEVSIGGQRTKATAKGKLIEGDDGVD
jgi:hypothetical protein